MGSCGLFLDNPTYTQKHKSMKTWITTALVALMVAGSFVASAQELIFSSTFETGNDGWFEQRSSPQIDLYAQNGKYVINRKASTGNNSVSRKVSLVEDSPFIISLETLHKGGVENNGYGLQLYNSSKSQSLIFMITANGYYKLLVDTNKTMQAVVDFTKTGIINPSGQLNKLTISNDSVNNFTFSINDSAVINIDLPLPFLIGQIALIIYKNQIIEFDNINIYQDKNINLVKGMPANLMQEHLPTTVNSEAEELMPVISSDGKHLFFTRQNHPDNVEPKNQDPWFCTLNANGNWSTAEKMPDPISNSSNNAILSVMPDNNTLLLLNKYFKDGSLGKGVSMTKRTLNGWSFPEPIEIEDYYNNNKYGEYFLTADQQHMLMSVERDNGYGERDLYVSHRKPDGSYSQPANLGEQLNTKGSEIGPFLAADGRTLYFSSTGLPGYGGQDIFISRRIGDGWQQWTEPQNLGMAINSPSFDAFFRIDAKGEYAYMSSYNNSIGLSDVIRIKLPNVLKPNPVAIISGRVYNKKTNEPLATTITYHNLKTGEKVGQANSEPTNGQYQIVLPTGSKYGFNAEKEGFYPISENIDLENLTQYTEVKRDLPLAPLEKETTIRLNNLFFDHDKFDLLPESRMELDNLFDILQKNPNMKIEIQGHTDSDGSETYNLTLSDKRARAVTDYLINKRQVQASRLTSKGFGESQPIATNNTEEGKQQNRRVEFKIIEL